MRDMSSQTRFSEVEIHAGSRLDGQTLGESKLRDQTGLLVISLKHKESNAFVYNPLPEEKLTAGTVLIIIGSVDAVDKLRELALCK